MLHLYTQICLSIFQSYVSFISIKFHWLILHQLLIYLIHTCSCFYIQVVIIVSWIWMFDVRFTLTLSQKVTRDTRSKTVIQCQPLKDLHWFSILFLKAGSWRTIIEKSLSGAIMISYICERIFMKKMSSSECKCLMTQSALSLN